MRRKPEPKRHLDGNCQIREHAGDGAYVGRCCFAVYDGECPRHGLVADYPHLDDREVAVHDRRWPSRMVERGWLWRTFASEGRRYRGIE